MRPFLFFAASAVALMTACNTHPDPANSADPATASAPAKDTLAYAYKATYSSDITVPSHPEYAQKVLTVWKMFESNRIKAMRPYWADSVIYHDASGLNFHGPADALLAIARKDIEGLDSLRFDISTWESAHSNDKNEDWIRIWAAERRYPKKGKADTTLIQENWLMKEGKITYFDQYKAKPAK
jgi:hypothetical protein